MTHLFFEIIIKDDSYRKIGTWKFPKKDAAKRLNDINSIFGLGLKITDIRTDKEEDRDLDWLK